MAGVFSLPTTVCVKALDAPERQKWKSLFQVTCAIKCVCSVPDMHLGLDQGKAYVFRDCQVFLSDYIFCCFRVCV